MLRHPSSPHHEPTRVGVILAGGLAARMGGGHKGLLRVGGRAIFDRVAGVLQAGCATVVLNANGDRSELAGIALPLVTDTLPGRPGPLAGVLAAMEWTVTAHPTATHIVTVPGDTPFLPDDLLVRLEAARRAANATLACARSGGATHPVVALWPVALRDELRVAVAKEGVRKVGLFLARHDVASADWPIEPYDPFLNINTPADLAEAEAISTRYDL